MVALEIALALVMLVKRTDIHSSHGFLLSPSNPSNIFKCYLMALSCVCHKPSVLSAEMKAELEKAKKEAEAAKKVTF